MILQPSHTSAPAERSRRGLGPWGGLILALGLWLPGCVGPRVLHDDSAAREATAAEDWPRAADLWFQVHLGEEQKTALPYLETARALRALGDSESACNMLEQGLQRFPYEVLLLEEKGRFLEECGYKRAAEAAYSRLVAVDDRHLEGLAALGRLRLGLGLERAAAIPLERLVELGHADAVVYAQLGEIYSIQEEPERALESFERSIDEGGEDPYVLLSAVQLARELSPGASDPRALTWLDKLIDLRPQCTAAHYLRGLALIDLDRQAEATTALRRAVETDPSYLKALVKLAEVYAQQGQASQASEMALRALALEPAPERRLALQALLDR